MKLHRVVPLNVKKYTHGMNCDVKRVNQHFNVIQYLPKFSSANNINLLVPSRVFPSAITSRPKRNLAGYRVTLLQKYQRNLFT